MLLAQRLTLLKAKPYGLVTIRTDSINQALLFDQTLDNSIWDKISESIKKKKKKVHLWNEVRLSLRGRKLIINQILLSKL